MTEPRRLPPPWTVDDLAAAFVVRDETGQALAYLYFEEEPERDPITPIRCHFV